MEKQLNESQRDALVTGYIRFVGRTLNNVLGTPLTTEDLYEYLLLDPEVADEVTTSRVASAIASLQTYMTRIVNGSEPGFQPVVPSDANGWRDNDNQYAIWAAGAEVQNYAENYISPATRLEQSHYFKDLETTLNQNQLDPDRVQDAALAYLNQFEAVSNLYVLSGYIDQDKLATATYYFIGRTTTKPYRYYWRKMDLSKNRQDYKGNPVTPNCWSDWLPVELPLSGDMVLEHTVRPVFYNQRLYVAWVERNLTPQKDGGGNNTTQYAYRVSFGYKRFDDSWTAPNSTTLMTHQDGDKDAVEIERSVLLINEPVGFNLRDVNLLATTDFSADPGQDFNPYGRLMLGVFVRDFNVSGKEGKNYPTIYGYQYCDSAFNGVALGLLTRGELFAAFMDVSDTNTLQYALYDQEYVVQSVEPYGDSDSIPGPPSNANGPFPGSGDLHGSKPDDLSYTGKWWSRIQDLKPTDSGPSSRAYMDDNRQLRIEMKLNADFMNDFVFTEAETNSGGTSGFGFGRPNDSWGVTIRYHDGDTYTFENTSLIYEPASFGEGSVPDGIQYIVDYFNSPYYDSRSLWQIEIRNNNIGDPNSGSYSKYYPLSGKPVDFGDLNDLIENNALTWAFFSEPRIASIQNLSKIADTRKFYCAVRFVTANTNDANYCPNNKNQATFELDGTSMVGSFDAAFRQFNEADFPNGTDYVSVCLIVGDERINRPDGRSTGAEQVWNWYKVHIKKQDVNAPANLPQLKSNYDSKLGFAQYLDFCDASLPANTRLNTTFVRTLIDKASLGLDSLLDYTLQTQPLEAPLDPGGNPDPMDFNGANGLYFWELFFHMPFLVASRFADEQQFDDARQWLHYIFDPARADKNGAPKYWNVRPLTDPVSDVSRMLLDALDPDTQAYAHPVIYKKAVFLAYVSDLVAQGDLWYRQLTRDGLVQARVFYNLAAELLGSRPDVSLSSTWTAQTLDTLAASENAPLRDFEQAIDVSQPGGIAALPGVPIGYLQLADNGYFIAPLNTLMLTHWDALDARLYNLRHGLTVDGKPMSLALYATPADPIALLTQRAQSGTLVNGVSGAQLAIPPYRFSAILPRAYNAVATLSRFGENLLSLLERGDNASQVELQQRQYLDMSSYGITLQQQAIDGLAADQQALEASRAIAQSRHDSYYALYQENISSNEQLVMDTHTKAQSLLTSAQGVMTASGALKLLPNIFGMADGGSRYEGATEAVASVLITTGQAMEIVADRLATTEGYRRRREEWQIQYEQAQGDVDALNKQLDALTVRQRAAQTELLRAKAQQVQVQAMLNFLQNRFTQATLYQWLSGQLAALYYQVYDVVVAQCLSAQACWQYELGDFATTFIQTGAWNNHYRGLQVGETLQLNLQQMEAAYLARHDRRLEITRTVSLVDLLQAPQHPFDDQKQTGTFNFDLTEVLFDQDYPGHYMRQIRSISISLPTLLGPYQDAKAILTQTKSSTLLNASIAGVKYLTDPSGGKGDANIVTNLRASQQIALSSGLNDAGLFELNFGDERYLPFEGTGAVSSWTLAFPRSQTSPTQKAVLDALTDVIVHVRYTALDGGETFAQAVESTLSS
jgi:hypothetical protein